MMISFDHQSYMQAQIEEICRHKWIESQKAGHDLGDRACLDWIAKYARDFREWAMKSGRFLRDDGL